jgi:probable HAF family extracellular repeat protein
VQPSPLKFLTLFCVLSFALVTHALAATTYTYSDITVPGSISTSPRGINNNGDVVGDYQNSSGVFGFLLSGGVYTTINCPGAVAGTFAYGINDDGVIVGYYNEDLTDVGFEYINGECKSLPKVNGSVPYPLGINNQGHIVGYYFVSQTVTEGFELVGKTYTKISVPNATSTTAFGINLAGTVSGTYQDSSGSHAFLYRNGSYTTFNLPGSKGTTEAFGLNDKTSIVGAYDDPTTQSEEGYIYNTGKYQTLIVPGSVTTFPNAINDSAVVVGSYLNGGVNPQGFMATPTTD